MRMIIRLFFAALLALASAPNGDAQDAAAPIRRGSPSPQPGDAPAPAATPEPARPPAAVPDETPVPRAERVEASPPTQPAAPPAATPASRVRQEKPVRAVEPRPAREREREPERTGQERPAPEPRRGASRPTFDLSDQGDAYVAATLRGLESRWQSAIMKHDVETLDQLIAEDFVGTSSTGKVGSKSTLLDAARRDKSEYQSATAGSMAVRTFGPRIAVVLGVSREKGTTADGQRFTNERRFTDTWVERDGKWQCVASHASQIPKR